MKNSVSAGSWKAMAFSIGMAFAGLPLFAGCAGDKVVEPLNNPELQLAPRWRAPNGDLVGLTRLSMARPSMDSVNQCQTAVYFGKRGAADPYRYETKILPASSPRASLTNSLTEKPEVIRMRRFRFNVGLRRITRMADCVIENSPEMIATVKSLFVRSNSRMAAASVAPDQAWDFGSDKAETDNAFEDSSPHDSPEGESSSDGYDIIGDVAMDAAMGSANPFPRTLRRANSPLFVPAATRRGMGYVDCEWVEIGWVFSCFTDWGITTCGWVPGGGTSDWFQCTNGCWAILGWSGSGVWCPEYGPGDPGDGCESGQIMNPDGNCVCEPDGGGGGLNNLSANERLQIGGRSAGGGDDGLPDEDQEPFAAEAPADATLFGPGYLTTEYTMPIRAPVPLEDDMPDCGGVADDPPPEEPIPVPQVSCPLVLRGAEVTCTVDLDGTQGIVNKTYWRFIGAANGSISPALDVSDTTAGSLQWTGKVAISGDIVAQVEFTNGGRTAVLFTQLAVGKRPWTWVSKVKYSKGTAPDCLTTRHYESNVWGWAIGQSSGICTADILVSPDFQAGYTVAVGTGPNKGLWFVASISTELHVRT